MKAASKNTYVHVRWMIQRDMSEVLDIEADGFEHPWLEDDFRNCLKQRNAIGMVAECEDRVAGFMVYELERSCLRIVNFAVGVEYRRKRVGAQMIFKLMNKLSSQRRSKITCEVGERNLQGQLFFRAMGFEAIAVLPEFYEATGEDAYAFRFRYNPDVTEALRAKYGG